MKKERKRALLWSVTILIALSIFICSSLTFSSSNAPGQSKDFLPILYHILAFFFLATFFLLAMKPKNNKTFVLVIIILLLYAFLDEVHQLFVPGRFFDMFDFLCDSIGIFFGTIASYKLKKIS